MISAEGFNGYKIFVIQTNFKEDKWIKSVQFHLKPKVIHHMWFFIMDRAFNLKPSKKYVIHTKSYVNVFWRKLQKEKE